VLFNRELATLISQSFLSYNGRIVFRVAVSHSWVLPWRRQCRSKWRSNNGEINLAHLATNSIRINEVSRVFSSMLSSDATKRQGLCAG